MVAARQKRVLEMRITGAIAFAGLLFLTACSGKQKSAPEPTATGLQLEVIEEEPWVAVARRIDAEASVEAGLAEALEQAAQMGLSPDGNPMVIYEGEGMRAVAFPVAGPARLEAPWFMRNVEAATLVTTTVAGGLREAAARNDDFLLEARVLGHTVLGPVYHRVLSDPRHTEPDELEIQLLAPLSL